MYKKLFCSATLAVTLVLSPTVFANSFGCGEGMKHMLESLKLDDAQKTKIKPIMEQLKSTMKEDGSQMKDLEKQVNQQAESATMDQSAVNDLIDKKSKLIGDMMKAKVSAKNQIYSILNPQQKAQLQDRMKKVEEKIAAKYQSCHDEE